ncbi:MAG: hypothetical protein QW096_13380 [Thermofilaceae archaeon]
MSTPSIFRTYLGMSKGLVMIIASMDTKLTTGATVMIMDFGSRTS